MHSSVEHIDSHATCCFIFSTMTAKEILDALLSAYGEPPWWSDDPWTVCVQAVLVQHTAWSNVLKTWETYDNLLGVDDVLDASDEELAIRIRSCGFAKAKTKTIKALASFYSSLDWDKPLDLEEMRNGLLSLKGIGEESADVILTYAFHLPSFAIDAYTRRLMERLDGRPHGDEELRTFFEEGLGHDVELFGRMHWLILEQGKTHCRAVQDCTGCPLSHACLGKCVEMDGVNGNGNKQGDQDSV